MSWNPLLVQLLVALQLYEHTLLSKGSFDLLVYMLSQIIVG